VWEKHTSAESVADEVHDIYKTAKKASRRKADGATRTLFREALQERLLSIAEPYLKDKDAAEQVMAKTDMRVLANYSHSWSTAWAQQ